MRTDSSEAGWCNLGWKFCRCWAQGLDENDERQGPASKHSTAISSNLTCTCFVFTLSVCVCVLV